MRATAVESYGGMKFLRIFEPAVVRTPRVTITSLIPTGTPPRGGSFSPFAARASICAAFASARSFDRVRNAPIAGSLSSILAYKDSASAVAVVVRSAMAERAASMVRVLKSISVASRWSLARSALNHLGYFEEGSIRFRRVEIGRASCRERVERSVGE